MVGVVVDVGVAVGVTVGVVVDVFVGVAVASGVSCRQQIGHFADRRPVHVAEALEKVIG